MAAVLVGLSLMISGLSPLTAAGQPADAAGTAFFEEKIRPVLVEHCYSCHNSAGEREGGLALDHRAALLRGGSGGKVLVPGEPEQSRLIAVIAHEIEDLEMPQGGPRLSKRVVDDFRRWVAMGAPDPRDRPPTAEEVAEAASWEAALQRRKQWWSLQPLQAGSPPAVDDPRFQHPVDRFLVDRMRSAGLEPSAEAAPSVIVRRLFLTLIGLPPTAEQLALWSSRLAAEAPPQRQAAVEQLVDELLRSPHFGEKWARHWMDWIRYAESHGSEGDPVIDNAWLYRDYLIRAWNADTPYDQLVREHIAGDLLLDPRIDPQTHWNESVIGAAHWRMVFHGFAPTDALDERVRFTDDQINAFSKAFLGLTVSCARCHDHKFDAISQQDYYALFGVLASCRPARSLVETPLRRRLHQSELEELKPRIRQAVAERWLESLDSLSQRWFSADGLWRKAEKPDWLLHPLAEMHRRLESPGTAESEAVAAVWNAVLEQLRASRQAQRERRAWRQWNLARESDYQSWLAAGDGLPAESGLAGQFAVASDGQRAVAGIYPAGVISHAVSDKHAARLTSPDMELDRELEVWMLARGGGGASARYVVQDYPRNGTVYPVGKLPDVWRWIRYDVGYWRGDRIHLEFAAARDAPLLVDSPERSWFAVADVMLQEKGGPAPPAWEPRQFAPLLEQDAPAPATLDEAAARYVAAARGAIQAWRDGTAGDEQALWLDACLRQGLLENRIEHLGREAGDLLRRYLELESEIPAPTRVPGLETLDVVDQPLFERGNHKRPLEPTPRRFLEAVDAAPYPADQSGRLQLADNLLRDDNPIARRVIVNRLWHHLFGQGLVRTPDNLGKLGMPPTHPELLDWLAVRFVEEGWSLKRCIRLLVTSEAWRFDSTPSEQARREDPDNLLRSHAAVRRLEAEAIRDSLLAVSGNLDPALFGSPVGGDSPRRSIYVRVIRNDLDPFLRVFDFPEPFTAHGRRDATNVPAQSLTLMNDPRVLGYARDWAERVLRADDDARGRIRTMFRDAFAREPSEEEVEAGLSYVAATSAGFREQREQRLRKQELVVDLQKRMEALLRPAREELLTKRLQAAPPTTEAPAPLARWEFDDDARDGVGKLHCELRGGARLEGGGLVVDGRGYAVTPPLDFSLTAKTLEAWVQLAHPDQRGGGVMSVQTLDGGVFDAIVYGERDPGQWLAGSNFFARTQPFGGPAEEDATQRPVHLAIVYGADGRIAGYRDGRPYGQAYAADGPVAFEAGKTVVSLGLRHLPAQGNRLLQGRILRAQLYDRALTAAEIAASAGRPTAFVADQEVLASLSPEQRRLVLQWRADQGTLQQQLDALGPSPDASDEMLAWTEFARAVFTMQEFIYVP